MKGHERSVVVIGAGFAGLAAAWRLSRRGFSVRVIERAAHVGGRASAHVEEGTFLEAVSGPLCAAHRHLHAWIDELGLRDELLPLRPVVVSAVSRGEPRDVEVAQLADVRRVPGVRWWEALRLVRLPRLLARYGRRLDLAAPERAESLDDRSVADFCRLYFGPSVLEHWLAPLLLASAQADVREASRVLLLLDLREHGLARPGLPRAPLVEVALRAAVALPVALGVEARALARAAGGGVRVETTAGVLEADAVVLAAPAPESLRVAAPLLGSAEREALGAVRYASALTVAAVLHRPLRARPGLLWVPPSEESPLACARLEPGVPGGRVADGRGLLSLCATPEFAAAHLGAPSEAVEKDLLAAFERFWPGAQRGVERVRTLRVHLATPRFDVGRYRQLARWQRLQCDARAAGRRVYFAGDYLAHPSLEGALVSAERAVAEVAEDLG